MNFPRWGAALAVLSLSLGARAAPPQAASANARVFGLKDAIEYALAHYPAVRAALERIRAAQGATGLARTRYLPSADLLWQSNRATDNNITGLLLPQGVIPSLSGAVRQSPSGASAWGAAAGALVSWEPFDFGSRGAAVDAARAGEDVATAQSDLARLGVASATARAFFALLSAEQTLEVAQANVNRWQVFDKSVHTLVDNQLRPGADASRADAELARARTQRVAAETAANAARAAFADLLGIAGTNVDVAAGPLLDPPPPEDPSPAPLASHPAVIAQRDRIRQTEFVEHGLARSFVPRFYLQSAVAGRGSGLAPDGRFEGGDNGLGMDRMNWAAGLTVTFPLFSYFAIHDQRKIADAVRSSEQDLYDQSVQDLSDQVEQARAVLHGARQVAENTPVELSSARASELQARARYEAGLGTIVEITDAQSLLVQAEIDDALARLNVWQALEAVAAAEGDLQPFLRLVK